MSDITLIAAIGRRGQLGLNGGLPWAKEMTPAASADLKRFREITSGGIIIAGHRTMAGIAHIDGTHGRLLLEDDLRSDVFELVERIARRFRNPNIFIAGGAKTYARWAPRCTRFDITRLPYDGPADVWMPALDWSQP